MKRKILRVSGALLAEFFRGPLIEHLTTQVGFPVDGRIVTCVWRAEFDELCVVVESESFDPVSPNSPLPDLIVTLHKEFIRSDAQ